MKRIEYEEASEIVQRLGIQTIEELKAFCKSDRRPLNFPKSVCGGGSIVGWEGKWKGVPAFLGRKNIGHVKRERMGFEEARGWARGLGLKTEDEWRAYCDTHKLPKGILKTADEAYEEWGGWKDWLMKMPTYDEVKEWVYTNGIKGAKHYNWFYRHEKLPEGYPFDPERFYMKRGIWISWEDFTGSETDYREYLGYEEARALTRTLGVMSEEYIKMGQEGKLPKGLPLNPYGYFKVRGKWTGWGDYLGKTETDRKLERHEVIKSKVRAIVMEHLIVSRKGFQKKLEEMKGRGEDISQYIVCPVGIAVSEWLCTKDVVAELVRRVHGLGVTSDKDWERRVKGGVVDLVMRYSLNFYRRYGYEGKALFGDTWEPTKVVLKVPILSYEAALPIAQKFCKDHGIDTSRKWYDMEEGIRHMGLPSNPNTYYKGCGWKGWKEWTGRLWDVVGDIREQIDTNAVDTNGVHVIMVEGKNRILARGIERWCPVSFIPGFEMCLGYIVSTRGRVYNRWKGKLVPQHKIGGKITQHLAVAFNELRLAGRTPGILVHRLVALAFISNPDGKPMVNHIDSNPQNNDISNLEWVTARENNYHAILSGAKESALSAEVVAKVKLLLYQGKRVSDISAATDISYGTIQNINFGKTYKWVGAGQFEYPIRGTRKVQFRIPEDKQREIMDMRSQGIPFRVIAEKVDICTATVYAFFNHADRSRETVPAVRLSALKIVGIHQKNSISDVDLIGA